jgi:ubiquinone/menaquinone biosynthesis C-methylase UbiE
MGRVVRDQAIKEFWNDRARRERLRPDATLRDKNLRLLEIEVIKSFIPIRKTVVDIGCGNGFSTLVFSRSSGSQMIGVDASPEMIKFAKKRFGSVGGETWQKSDFIVGSAYDLPLKPAKVDGVITERCLMNISTWSKQKRALREISRILRPKGTFIMLEGIEERLEQLNRLRTSLGLRRIRSPWHNLNICEKRFRRFIKRYFRIESVNGFGVYYVASRVLYPLSILPDEPDYDSKINKAARKLSTVLSGLDDISHEMCIVLKRR